MANFLSYARGPQFMGRKLVRENGLLRSGGLLSFPRTGCALRASVILSRAEEKSALWLHQSCRASPSSSGPSGSRSVLGR